MAVAEEERTDQHGGDGAKTALKAAAAAAATGAATYAVRKAFSHDDDDSGDENENEDGEPKPKSKQSKGKTSKRSGGSSSSLMATAAASAWDSASDVVLPMAEDAVAAAGRYLAERAPEVVRERLVPRFIDAFNEAS